MAVFTDAAEDSPFGDCEDANPFHCLGCGAGGSVIDFVMKHDGLSFRHAVEALRDGKASALVASTSPKKKTTRHARTHPARLTLDAPDVAQLASGNAELAAELAEEQAELADEEQTANVAPS